MVLIDIDSYDSPRDTTRRYLLMPAEQTRQISTNIFYFSFRQEKNLPRVTGVYA